MRGSVSPAAGVRRSTRVPQPRGRPPRERCVVRRRRAGVRGGEQAPLHHRRVGARVRGARNLAAADGRPPRSAPVRHGPWQLRPRPPAASRVAAHVPQPVRGPRHDGRRRRVGRGPDGDEEASPVRLGARGWLRSIGPCLSRSGPRRPHHGRSRGGVSVLRRARHAGAAPCAGLAVPDLRGQVGGAAEWGGTPGRMASLTRSGPGAWGAASNSAGHGLTFARVSRGPTGL